MENQISRIKNTVNIGALSYFDIHFADFVLKVSGETDNQDLFLAAAMVSHMTTGRKNICFSLSAEPGTSLLSYFPEFISGDSQHDDAVKLLKSISIPENWRNRVSCAQIVGNVTEEEYPTKPLLLDGDLLYLTRYWQYQRDLADIILKKTTRTVHENKNIKFLQERLHSISSIFKEPSNETDWQKVAVFASMYNDFTVITGGPGTGKTTIMSIVTALLFEQNPDIKIALCAPTGKAQARLQEAIISQTENLHCREDVLQNIRRLRASTVHRLLHMVPNSPFFYKNAENKLDADVLIVDEASMMSLPLMTKLLASVNEKSKIILLGDKDQLASIETGAVLGDICSDAFLNRFSDDFIAQFAKICPDAPALPNTDVNGTILNFTINLRKNYRFQSDKGLGRLTQAVNAGNSVEVQRILSKPDSGELLKRALPGDNQNSLFTALEKYLQELNIYDYDNNNNEKSVIRPFLSYIDITDGTVMDQVDAAYSLFSKSAILCAHRKGLYGVENINKCVMQILKIKGEYAKGVPVIINSNDYNLNLFNGDIGLCWNDINGEIKVYFPNPHAGNGDTTGKFRVFPVSQLPDHGIVFAMTVHKSQGSGFQNVLLILPEHDSPLLTSELIYTGLTRTQKRVEIWAEDTILEKAVNTKIKRWSGLKNALSARSG